jgi:Bacterial regulatory proteins, crp family
LVGAAGGSRHFLQLHLVLTHEEIGEMIGTTRETVTRLFSDFKMKAIHPVNGFPSGDPQQVCAGTNDRGLK